ncbi:MAG: hypothetical protein GY861_22960 [bacterium]|nr:hypothetical protein [bacterium]
MTKTLPAEDEFAEKLHLASKDYKLIGETLYHLPIGPETRHIHRPDLIVIPAILQSTVMQSLHDDLLAGHLGIAKTLARIRQCYFWDGMN